MTRRRVMAVPKGLKNKRRKKRMSGKAHRGKKK
jgi:hypothetical protein